MQWKCDSHHGSTIVDFGSTLAEERG